MHSKRNIFADLTTALYTDDRKTAHLLAHTIKGSADLIQEHVLSQAAEHIEHTLAKNEIPTDDSLSTLEAELTKVLENIIPALPTIGQSLNKDEARILFDELKPLLRKHDSRCHNKLEALRTIPEAALVAWQIENFDLDIALKNVEVLEDMLF